MALFLRARDSSLPFNASSLVMSIVVASCASPKTENLSHQTILNPDVAPGTVLIDVLEGGRAREYFVLASTAAYR